MDLNSFVHRIIILFYFNFCGVSDRLLSPDVAILFLEPYRLPEISGSRVLSDVRKIKQNVKLPARKGPENPPLTGDVATPESEI
jgi:hypothetical protein